MKVIKVSICLLISFCIVLNNIDLIVFGSEPSYTGDANAESKEEQKEEKEQEKEYLLNSGQLEDINLMNNDSDVSLMSIADLSIFTRETPDFSTYSKAQLDASFRYDYYIKNKMLYKYDLETNQIIQTGLTVPTYNITHIEAKGAYLYVGCYLGNSEVRIIGYNTNTDKQFYDQVFPVGQAIGESFTVDSKQNFYFTTGSNEIRTYNSNAVLIDSMSSASEGVFGIVLQQVTPNDDVLLYTGNYRHDGYITLDKSGKFVDKNYRLFYQNRTPRWKFLSNTLAVDQYGEIARFNFNDTNINSNVSYSLLLNADNDDITYPAVALMNNNVLVMSSGKGKMIEYDFTNGKILKYLDIGTDKIIQQIDYSSGIIYVQYLENGKRYISRYSEADFNKTEKKLLTTHSSLKHTKEEITKAYQNSTSSFDYTQNIYTKTPSVKAPYIAGGLKEQVKKDTLNQLNFLRWLAGLNSLTVNEKYMERSQKGAVLLKATDELTHNPVRPSDMDDQFYSEGSAGVGAGYNYSGNVSYGYQTMPDAILGYTNDDYNVMPGVGHRSSMLDPNAVSTSFGYVSPYNAVSIYTQSNQASNKDAFYSWPSPGYFPVESISKGARWSIQVMDPYEITKTSIVLTYDGKNYNAKDYFYDDYYHTLSFALPTELSTLITDKNGYKKGANITVSLYNVLDESGNIITIQYPVRFFGASQSYHKINPIKNLKATNKGATSIQLSWDATDQVDGYLIYRQIGKGKFKYLTLVKGTSYLDKAAITDEFNFYRVYPYKEIDGEKILGESKSYVYAKPTPAPVKNLKAVSYGANIKLTWSASNDCDGYIIYRQIGKGKFEYRYIVKGNGFIDSTAKLNEYNFYRVYAYKEVNGKKVISSSLNYVYSKPILGSVINLKAKGISNHQILITWNPYQGADGYLVYRQSPGTNKFQYLLKTSSTGFKDLVKENDKYYFYRVYPYKEINGKMKIGTSANYVYSKSK